MWQLFHPEWFQAITGSTRACLEIKGYSTCSPPLRRRADSQALIPQKGISTPSSASCPKGKGHPTPGGWEGTHPSEGPAASSIHPGPQPQPRPLRGRGGERARIQHSSTMQVAFLLFQANKSRSGAVGPEKGAFPLMNVISIPVNIHKITPALICIK